MSTQPIPDAVYRAYTEADVYLLQHGTGDWQPVTKEAYVAALRRNYFLPPDGWPKTEPHTRGFLGNGVRGRIERMSDGP